MRDFRGCSHACGKTTNFLSLVVLFFILLTSFSCKVKGKGDSFEEYFCRVERIKLTQIPFDVAGNSPFFSHMFLLGYIDSIVVVNEFLDPDFTFKLVDLRSGSVKKFGKRGEGPNELISEGGYFLLDHVNNHFIIGDDFFNYVYKSKELFDDNPLPVESFRFETEDDRFLGHRVFADGRIFGSTYLERFASYRVLDKKFERHEQYAGGGSQALAHQGYFISHPTEFRIAYGMRSYPEFGIIDQKNGELQIQKWNWGDFFSQVEESEDGTLSVLGGLDEKLHFFSTAAGAHSVFLLHSGQNLREPDGQVRRNGMLPDRVYQLGWDGSPRAVLQLGQAVKAIAVDPKENLLFAASATENPELLIYKLPDR